VSEASIERKEKKTEIPHFFSLEAIRPQNYLIADKEIHSPKIITSGLNQALTSAASSQTNSPRF
jgi:hypothetical protein